MAVIFPALDNDTLWQSGEVPADIANSTGSCFPFMLITVFIIAFITAGSRAHSVAGDGKKDGEVDS